MSNPTHRRKVTRHQSTPSGQHRTHPAPTGKAVPRPPAPIGHELAIEEERRAPPLPVCHDDHDGHPSRRTPPRNSPSLPGPRRVVRSQQQGPRAESAEYGAAFSASASSHGGSAIMPVAFLTAPHRVPYTLQDLPTDVVVPPAADGEDGLPRQLKINGLPATWNLADMQQHFAAFGQVELVSFGRLPPSLPPQVNHLGYGFVYYMRAENAVDALIATRRAPYVPGFWAEYCDPQRSRFRPEDPRHPGQQQRTPDDLVADSPSKATTVPTVRSPHPPATIAELLERQGPAST